MSGIIKENNQGSEELDQEWISLIREALQCGLTKEEIRVFLSLSHSKGG